MPTRAPIAPENVRAVAFQSWELSGSWSAALIWSRVGLHGRRVAPLQL